MKNWLMNKNTFFLLLLIFLMCENIYYFAWVTAHGLKSQAIMSHEIYSHLDTSMFLIYGFLLFWALFLRILTFLIYDNISSYDASFSFMLCTSACLLNSSPLLTSSLIAITFSRKTFLCTYFGVINFLWLLKT